MLPPTPEQQVLLVGRLGSRIDERTLPSGDQLTTFTVIVDRPARARRGRVRVDAIPCVAVTREVSRRVAAAEKGSWVQVHGSLRRRFWRSAGGLGSALEVEARVVRRL